jgi:hypothetical protein
MPQNVKKSKAPPLSAPSKFRRLAIDKEFFSTLLGGFGSDQFLLLVRLFWYS